MQIVQKKKPDPVCLTHFLCFHKLSHILIFKCVLNYFDASHALVWIPHLKLCIKHWAGKPRVPGECSRTDVAWKEETHSYGGLFTVFADGTRLMQDNITVLCVNDNNPPGLSISTRSLWPAKRGRSGHWSTEDCGFCSSEVAKIATGGACDYRQSGRARERPGRGLMKPHTDTNDWARCFSSRRGIWGAGQEQVHS